MAGTFHSCINQCAARNKNQPGLVKCGAVAYDSDLTEAIGGTGGIGNCWLKDAAGTSNTLDDDFEERYAVAELLD